MKDFKAIFKTYSGKIKDNVGLKAELGKKFKEGAGIIFKELAI